MAWRFKKVEEQRKELVESYFNEDMTMTELCEKFGISRKTAYKWCERYKKEGDEGLKNRPKAPLNPNSFYSKEVMNMAIDLKLKKRSYGPRKILEKLKRKHPEKDLPSATRLYEVFKKNNLIAPRRIRNRVPATHPLGYVNHSNDVWIADFKGWFLTRDRSKCEPFTVTDGFSRYVIRCLHLDNKSAESVWVILAGAFHEYGLPYRIRTDNGPPFGSVGIGRLTPLSIKIIKAGVIPEWINPGHPEENGRHERFHLTLKNEVADPPAQTLKEQLEQLKIFQEEYNFERPHEALEMKTPSEYYCKSPRQWDGKLRSPEYDSSVQVRKVGQNGCIWVKQTEYYISQSLTGEYISIEDKEEGMEVRYGPIYLGKLINGNKRVEKPKLKQKRIIRRG